LRRKNWPLGPAIVLLAWVVLYWGGLVNPLLLPSPWEVFLRLSRGLFSRDLLRDLGATVYRAGAGILLASLIGIPLGAFMGASQRFQRHFGGLVDFFRSIPATAMLPLFMVAFGIGDQTRILLVVFCTSLIMIVNTHAGVRNVSRARLMAARAMGATRWQSLSRVAVMDALPQVFTGFRVSVSLSLIIVVVTEMLIGTSMGLGHRIYEAQLIYNSVEMFAAIILTGCLGAGLNLILDFVEKRHLHWAGR